MATEANAVEDSAQYPRSNPSEDPDWISYFDALELAGEAAYCFRDLGQA
jgi:hypothetical protein